MDDQCNIYGISSCGIMYVISMGNQYYIMEFKWEKQWDYLLNVDGKWDMSWFIPIVAIYNQSIMWVKQEKRAMTMEYLCNIYGISCCGIIYVISMGNQY